MLGINVLAVLFMTPRAFADPVQTTATRITNERFLEAPTKFKPATPYRISERAVTVDFARYPLPDVPAHKWSHWGPGTVLPDGRVLTSLGDHRAINGNSYLYEYNPETRVLRLVADLQSAVKGFKDGDFGFGKIHDRLNVGQDGNVYFSSFWGLRSGLEENFTGERLFRYNPKTRELADLGVPAKGWGYPSSNFSPQHNLYYAEAAYRPDYDNQTHGMRFFAFDVVKRKVRFMGGHDGTGYGRDLFVDASGNAYFNNGNRTLVRYDPTTNQLTDLGAVMPVSRLRRTAGPDDAGLLYATSADTNDAGHRILFSFDARTRKTHTIARLWADTPAMALHPGGRFIYMVPGNVNYPGRPLIRADLCDGSIEVVAFLERTIQNEQDFTLGGTYSLCVDDDTAYIVFGLNNDLALVAVGLPSHR
jgi:hypothetical protein